MAEHHVFLILGDFQGDLWSFSRSQHVWLLSSPHNDVQARMVWDREPKDYSALRGVTTFRGSGASVSEFYRMLGTVDHHHDEHSADVPWTAIHVRGVAPAEISDAAVADEIGDGFQIFPEPGGFAIIRAAQQGDAADDRPQMGDRG